MTLSSLCKTGTTFLLLTSTYCCATGVVPETSVLIVEQDDGEGTMNVQNTDSFPVLLLTTVKNIEDDNETLLTVTPPVARIEANKTQLVRFIMTSTVPLKTERLKRVIFEGVPPQKKGQSEFRITMRQNLPLIIRPAGLEKNQEPWKLLSWSQKDNSITVSNPSPYVVRLGQGVKTLPDNAAWTLPNPYVLPGQTLTITSEKKNKIVQSEKVRISPATTWGHTVGHYDAPLSQ